MTVPATIAHAVQQSQEWLKELRDNAGLASETEALSVLRAVLQQLRDRLTINEAVQLGAPQRKTDRRPHRLDEVERVEPAPRQVLHAHREGRHQKRDHRDRPLDVRLESAPDLRHARVPLAELRDRLESRATDSDAVIDSRMERATTEISH